MKFRDDYRQFLIKLMSVFLSLIIIISMVVLVHHRRTYTSDDVAMNALVENGDLSSRSNIRTSPGPFVLKLPFVLASNGLFGYTRLALVFENILQLSILYLLLIRSISVLTRRFSIKYSLFVVPILISSPSVVILLTNPTSRSLEFGILILLAAQLVRLYSDEVGNNPRRYLSWAAPGLLMGVLSYSDPYFLILGLPPIFLIIIYHLACRYEKISSVFKPLTSAITLIASLLVCRLLAETFLGLKPISAELAITRANVLFEVIGNNIISFLRIFSILPLDPFSVARLVCLLILIAISIRLLYRKKMTSFLKDEIFAQILIAQILLTAAVSTVTMNSQEIMGLRYILLIPMAGFFLISFILSTSNLGRHFGFHPLVLLLFVLTLLSFLEVGLGYYNNPQIASDLPINAQSVHNPSNEANEAIAAAINSHHLTKGYADYWDSNINSYFSGSKIFPVDCGKWNQLSLKHWWINDDYKTRPATQTYIIYNRDSSISSSDKWCGSASRLAEQLGQPTEVISISNRVKILMYDYDILKNLNQTE